MTLQIKALESDLGVRLFNRKTGSGSLTRQGSLLLTYANKLAGLVSEVERELSCKDGKLSGELSLGVSSTIAQYVLSRLLNAFLAEYPLIDVTPHSGNTSENIETNAKLLRRTSRLHDYWQSALTVCWKDRGKRKEILNALRAACQHEKLSGLVKTPAGTELQYGECGAEHVPRKRGSGRHNSVDTK